MKLTFLINTLLLTVVSQFSLAVSHITPSTLPANENKTTLVNIDEFGRYIIQAKSDQGVAFGLNDKKFGKGRLNGQANKIDGRFSGFLDVGQYQIFTQTSPENTNTVSFDIVKSTAINQGDVPVLNDAQLQSLQLENAQHYDFAFEISTQKMVHIEAAGRNLEDLQLFTNGQWLVESTIRKSTVQPVEGQPLTRIQMSVMLQPGVYRLSAFGGQALSWANDEDTHPLYVRKGFKQLDLDTSHEMVISPFGEDFYIMEKGNDYLNVQLPIKSQFSFGVGTLESNTDVFANRFSYRQIDKIMDVPTTSFSTNSYNEKIIKFTGNKDQGFLFTSILKRFEYSNFQNANYTVSSISVNHPDDYLDVTWYVKDYSSARREYFITDYKAINVSKNTYYQRRFNVTGQVQVLLNIEDSGSYDLVANNKLSALYKLEPIFYTKDYKRESFRGENLTWNINAGLYLLTIKPKNKGVLDLTIKNSENKGALNPANNTALKQLPHQAVLNNKRLNVDSTLVMLNNGNELGLDIRKTKVQLEKAMVVYLLPNQSITLETLYVNDGKLQFEERLANQVSISVANSNYQFGDTIKSHFKVQPTTIKNTSKEWVKMVVRFVHNENDDGNEVLTITQSKLNAIAQLEELNVNYQPFFELDGYESFAMKVNEPGLYAIESTGLLATIGGIRNKLNEKYQDVNQSGTGRNFYIQTYLLTGDYQLGVQSLGESKGNTSLKLTYSPIIDKGEITLGAKYFENISNTQALKYKIKINEADNYRIEALTVDSALDIRLDDIDGWPVIKPGSNASRVEFLEKGEYYITVLPKPVPVATSLLIEKITKKIEYPQNDEVKIINVDATKGNNVINYTWLERTNEQGERVKDRWRFELNTDADINIEFSDTVALTLINTQTNKTVALFDIQEVYSNNRSSNGPKSSWTGLLEKGQYEIEIMAKGKNNKLPYSLDVNSQSLLFGQTKTLYLPENVTFKLSNSEQVSISTFGIPDVTAKLYDANNQLLQRFDDSGDNWNFMLNAILAKGEYRIELDGLTQSKSTVLSFTKPKWDEVESLLLPVAKQITANNNVIIPISIKEKSTNSDVLNVVVNSKQTINVSVEEFKFNSWHEIAYQQGENIDLLVPIRKELKPLRVKLFSSLNQPLNVDFNIAKKSISVFNQSALFQVGIQASKILDQSNWYVAKFEDIQLSKIVFDRKVKTSDEFSQELAGESNVLFSQNSVLWVASKQPLIKAQMQYLTDVNQVQLQKNDHGVIINSPNEKGADQTITVTLANVMQDHGAIYYQSKTQDKQNTMALDLNYSVTSTLLVPKKDQALHIKNAMNPNNPLLVKLQHQIFSKPSMTKWKESFTSILNSKESFALALPDDNRNTQINAPEKTLVQFVLNGKIQASFYSQQSMQSILFEGAADSVYLFSLDDQSHPFSVIKVNRFNTHENTSAYQLLDIKQTLVSTHNLVNEYSKRQFVEVSHESMLLDENMNIQKGRVFKINNDAKLYIYHDGQLGGIWQSDVLVDIDAVNAQSIDFKNEYHLTDNIVIDTNKIKQTLLTLVSDQLINVHLIDQRGALTHKVLHPNEKHSLFVGEDLAFIEIQITNKIATNIHAQSIEGEVLDEGEGELTLIPSASNALFKFEMKHDGIMGFANRSNSDQLISTLFDENGVAIQTANLLMQPLNIGEYWILVENKQTNNVTQFQPVLLGITENNAVDVETINQYKQKAGWVK